ncbi:hypothetical protein Agabi119p4_11534 [Agaricus bisporus var. burnettii]|uniref:Uncharacterized protein n=1 Tax=Agaricus bisporus var. burnettii TaxID=192524 RepID=A0A8H7BVK7_AGABI|nr:hypothetical protein Agabi119p4_11534 [Agaricus bisporus var. burnettii]
MAAWSPPVLDLSSDPQPVHTYDINQECNFARSARWTPDGSMFMAQCENRTLQLFTPSSTIEPVSTSPSLVLPQSAPILDFAWYPTASPMDPSSFCVLASVRECPVKLLDASDGRLRASYKIVDHRERFIAPHSMTFNPTATKIYCGHEDAIEVFDVSQPGNGVRIPTTPSKKSKDGLKGIISALSFSPTYSTESDGFYAAATLNQCLSNLALYTESQPDGVPLMFVGGGPRAAVTQVRFNPMNPHILYAAYRRREEIIGWDLRSDVTVPFVKYVGPHRPTTNQKMSFDIDCSGRRLMTGDQQGAIHVFNLQVPNDGENSSETTVKYPDLTFKGHSDSVPCVGFHPYRPILLSVSGSRHFDDLEGQVDSDSGSDSDESESYWECLVQQGGKR